ncbi:hypothetical protein B0H67DRAFT_595699 [Lasiosphaeris hirsuta]|uniref:Ubiquitin-like protease family profile domain-containing protein n=1 Tax=Lasiosphaeris hirsuta TaxID=260670 RepID=A0AA39ZPG7_9PEZI|nr:hypothetical protein B0H67DRAFT_595699 [Lasiosphaeris hirsuta]
MEEDPWGRNLDRQVLAGIEQAELARLKELIDAFEKQRPQALLDNHRALIAKHGIDTATRIIFLLPVPQRASYLSVLARNIYGDVLDARSIPPLIKVCVQWQLLPTSLHHHFGCNSRSFFHSLQHTAARYSFAEAHAAINAAAARRKDRAADDRSAFSGVPSWSTHIPDDVKQALLCLDAKRSNLPAIHPRRGDSKRNRDGETTATRNTVPNLKRVRRGRARASPSPGGGMMTRSRAVSQISGHDARETPDRYFSSSEADTEAFQSQNRRPSFHDLHDGLDDGHGDGRDDKIDNKLDDGLDEGFASAEDGNDSIGSALEEPASPLLDQSVLQPSDSIEPEVARRMEEPESHLLKDITMPSPSIATEAQWQSQDPDPPPISPSITPPGFDVKLGHPPASLIPPQDIQSGQTGDTRHLATKRAAPDINGGAAAINLEDPLTKPEPNAEPRPRVNLESYIVVDGGKTIASTVLPGGGEAQGSNTLQKYLGRPTEHPSSMARFAPGKWLDDINMDAALLFLTLSSRSVVHISPTTVDTTQVDKQVSRITDAGIYLEMALLPLLIRGNHWILAVARPKSECIDIYDSMQAFQDTEAARQRVKLLIGRLQLYSWSKFPIRACLSLRQVNVDDCGVLCLATAAYLITGQTIPRSIDARLWRSVFKTMLAHDVIDGDSLLSSLPQIPHHRMPQNTQLNGQITPGHLEQLEQSLRNLKAEVERDYLSWRAACRDVIHKSDDLMSVLQCLARDMAKRSADIQGLADMATTLKQARETLAAMERWKPRLESVERALKVEIDSLEIDINRASDAIGMRGFVDQETLAVAEARLKGLEEALKEARSRKLEFVELEVAKWSFIAKT